MPSWLCFVWTRHALALHQALCTIWLIDWLIDCVLGFFLSKIFHLLRNVIIVGEELKNFKPRCMPGTNCPQARKCISRATSAMTQDLKSEASEGPPYSVAFYTKPGVLPSYINPNPCGNMRFWICGELFFHSEAKIDFTVKRYR